MRTTEDTEMPTTEDTENEPRKTQKSTEEWEFNIFRFFCVFCGL